jgi:NADH:ubiquinone oxidoreductase subunit 3 (subunit A)
MNWIGTLIVLAIPGVNIVMLFVWAITCKRASKRNFCIAVLVLSLICIAVVLALTAVYGNVIAAWLEKQNFNWILDPQALISATPSPTIAP